ncbi:L-histidine N(alpha)-methyltransferase [Geomonas anaerohicana]|uniref:L-histidine N(Alpha)-methyltransferase n=1 Tax=Geomonas anaerohicana TaxID=2798583 RepID=A0ABS0YBG9_9BACT|nr:L-histidine N(alpha)-methyltransferase [Geomonas anaerohicana]MBJ6749651.1 L-histidine N(alpha)-methyltransferase [Geomonas anaerohicana]
MDAFFASPEPHLCRNLRDACLKRTPAIVQSQPNLDPLIDFARSCVRGFYADPRSMESRFLYDEEGSALFEEITRQPEYYLTRTEAAILAAHAAEIRELTGPTRILELGSGSAQKTDHLLRAWLEQGGPTRYYPVDVSAAALSSACAGIRSRFPTVEVVGVQCQYREAFPVLAQLSPVLVAFLGSSIGNFTPQETLAFVRALAAALRPGDFFLLGLDLVKERSILEGAYNDQAGVSARFTRNLFARMNRELGAGIDLDAIEHAAWYRQDQELVEISARFTREQTFRLTPPGRVITIGQGELVRTEISRKFRLERVMPELEGCGFAAERVFTDDQGWFALLLLRRRPLYSPRRGWRRSL